MGSSRRRMVPALALAVALLATPSVGSAQEPPEGPVPPVETAGTDPVLDDVEVVATSGTRAADGAYTDATEAEEAAEGAAEVAEADRVTRQEVLATADGGVASAETALGTTRDELAAQELVLAGRQATQKTRRSELDDQQEELRRLAVGVFMSAPTDAFSWLAEPEDLSSAARRDAVRDRGVDQQSERVDEATVPWEEARDATEAQATVVEEAERQVAAAELVLLLAIAERDRSAELLTAAEGLVATTLAALQSAEEATQEAATSRRTARLTALVSGLDLRLVALDAYWRAAGGAPCPIPWWVLAGVGKVESRHGTAQGAQLTETGDTTKQIRGIPLNGGPGIAAIGDSDGGALDGDTVWDRAVGPMQFIPSTWRRWATDGNADGKADPHNIYDAAAAAAAYLCFGRGDLSGEAAQRGALLSYNASVPYGTKVLAEGAGYREALGLPDRPSLVPPED